MQKILLSAALLLCLAVLVASTVHRNDAPEAVYAFQPQGNAVMLDFRVHKFNPQGIELALNNPGLPTFFIQFDVVMQGLEPVVSMVGISNNSRLKGTAAIRNLPDFPFLRSKDGQPVLHFAFENQLGQDGFQQGHEVLRMTYRGTPVPLIETLHIQESFSLPSALNRMFGVERIEFLPGTLSLDRETRAFYIPVRVISDEK